MTDLKVTDADFDNAIAGLASTKDGFANMKSVGDELAGAVGHSGLAGACKDFISAWSVHRDRIQRAIDKHLELLKNTKKAFDEAEKNATPKSQDPAPSQDPNDNKTPPDSSKEPSGTTGQNGSSGGASTSGGGAGVPSVSGGGGGASLGSTDTEPHKDANQVNGGSAHADLGKDLPPGASKVGEVQGGGGHGEGIEGAETGPQQDANRVDDTPANAALIKQLKERGLPVFAVDGKVQRPLGQVEGIGTLLGSQDNPPVITAVVDSNGKVVDIADLKPEYDEKGNLTGLNQVPVKVADLGATREQPGAGDAKTPGVVDGSAASAPVLDTRTQEAVKKVKELFGDLVDVALTGGKKGGEPTLTVAGVSGIGLAALATLATLSRSGAADGAEAGAVGTKEDLRGGLSGLSTDPRGGLGPRQATDRQNLIDALMKDMSPEFTGGGTGSGASGAELRDALAGAGDRPAAPADGGGGQVPDGAPGTSGESLKESLSALGSQGKQGLGGDLPAGSSDLGLPRAAAAGSGGGSPATGGGLGGPLPGGAAPGAADAAPAAGGSAGPEQVSEAAHQGEVARERRNTHMMGGMGMAAGMSAAGGRVGLTGAEEEKRNEEARRLRDRLAVSKESN